MPDATSAGDVPRLCTAIADEARKRALARIVRETEVPPAPACAISVVVCTFRRPAALAAALASVAAQTLPPDAYEVVVVNNDLADVATSRTVSELRDRCFADRPDRLRLVACPFRGLSFARNAGIAAARGAIVSFIDDDAVASPDWLARVQDAFASHPGAGVVGGRVTLDLPEPRPRWAKRAGVATGASVRDESHGDDRRRATGGIIRSARTGARVAGRWSPSAASARVYGRSGSNAAGGEDASPPRWSRARPDDPRRPDGRSACTVPTRAASRRPRLAPHPAGQARRARAGARRLPAPGIDSGSTLRSIIKRVARADDLARAAAAHALESSCMRSPRHGSCRHCVARRRRSSPDATGPVASARGTARHRCARRSRRSGDRGAGGDPTSRSSWSTTDRRTTPRNVVAGWRAAGFTVRQFVEPRPGVRARGNTALAATSGSVIAFLRRRRPSPRPLARSPVPPDPLSRRRRRCGRVRLAAISSARGWSGRLAPGIAETATSTNRTPQEMVSASMGSGGTCSPGPRLDPELGPGALGQGEDALLLVAARPRRLSDRLRARRGGRASRRSGSVATRELPRCRPAPRAHARLSAASLGTRDGAGRGTTIAPRPHQDVAPLARLAAASRRHARMGDGAPRADRLSAAVAHRIGTSAELRAIRPRQRARRAVTIAGISAPPC